MSIFNTIDALVWYGQNTGLAGEEDAVYVRNRILDVLKLDDYEYEGPAETAGLEDILKALLDYASERGLLEQDGAAGRDLFDTRLMDCLMPRPSEIIKRFRTLYKESPVKATDYYYKLSGDSNYIRRYRMERNLKWKADTEYGLLDITINLSKPEKDPKAIAKALKMKASSYPSCLLCRENEGYAGRLNHPGRLNHRIIPITIDNSAWYLQYSPHIYYNEHCIVFNSRHTPMKIDKQAFSKLLDFIELFPHYFVGSNADLPIVGGSILSHDHFQGGRYTFAMAVSPIEEEVNFKGYADINAGILKWPMSVIRISGKDRNSITGLADKILLAWRGYTDDEAFVFSYTDGIPHNTITPIARKKGEFFELDLVLRNNITTEEYPDGVYHPHPEHHHIKKENIGLIEALGLAILPARLLTEVELVREGLLTGADLTKNAATEKHAEWAGRIKNKYDMINEHTVDSILKDEIGLVYKEILEQAGVFKRTVEGRAQFLFFVDYVNKLEG